MKYVFTIILVLMFSEFSFAQHYTYNTEDKKAIKLYKKALEEYNTINPNNGFRNWDAAESYALQALERDSNFYLPHDLLSKIYVETNQYKKALEAKKNVVRINPKPISSDFYYTASLAMQTGSYQDVLEYGSRYLKFRNTNDLFVSNVRRFMDNANFAIEAEANPYDYELINLGKGVNTERNEYFPSITADDELLLFTRDIEDRDPYGRPSLQEDIFVSKVENNSWSESWGVSDNINTQFNEGAPTFSSDGKYIIMVGCEMGPMGYGAGRKGYGSCDLFFSEKVGSKWSRPVNLGSPVNSGNWETQPSFSSDGKTLYFVRGTIKPGSRRESKDQDIYMTQITDKGWSKPVKLGPNINTPYREESVFIHPDGQTLYFSSEGHPGMGGLDIFMSRKQANGSWGKPINLGYPINTAGHENSLLVDAKGDLAYFASDREGGEGNLDLYSFKLPESFKPYQTLALKGKIYDAETKEPLSARFELIDIHTGEVFKEAYPNRGNGEFLVPMPINKDFALVATHKGYQLFSKNFSLTDNSIQREFVVEVPMQAIAKVGTSFVLENVFFDVDKSVLKSESKAELNRLYNILMENPEIKIEIGGHTDSDGDDTHNQELSENRARSVVDYLIKKGIAKERLSNKGYGESNPIAPNDTEENKAKNRRTEVKVVE